MLIPWQQLAADTLQRLIESFVLRDGTDYGEQEVALEDKAAAVLAQIKTGQVLIVYSELHESVDLISAAQFRCWQQEQNVTDY